MLKKEKTVSGAKLVVRDVTKDGLGGNTEGVRMTGEAGSVFEGSIFIPSGAILTVVRKPRKTDGINTVIVQYGNEVGHVYWCELRASCDHQ